MPFIDYEGRLAYATPWLRLQGRPVRSRHVYVWRVRATDFPLLIELSEKLGAFFDDKCISWNDTYGFVQHHELPKPVVLNTEDAFQQHTQKEPVKKPRRGKRQGQRYDWEWIMGKWERKWL